MNTLIVFVKYPEPGKVKTRIARELGAEKAADIYSLIAECVIERVMESTKYRTVIFFDPPEREAEIRQWLGREDIVFEPQSGITIGERMFHAFASVLSSGAEKAVLIGTDVPKITGEIVSEAFDLLDSEDAAIGPAEDGGYYLLGLKKAEALLFEEIEWGSGSVCEKTFERLRGLNIGYKTLDTLRDVDTPEDINTELLEYLTGGPKLRSLK